MRASLPGQLMNSLQLRNMRMDRVPTIDIGGLELGSRTNQRTTAQSVDKALASTGFLRLTNHGIDDDLVTKCFDHVGQAPIISHQNATHASHRLKSSSTCHVRTKQHCLCHLRLSKVDTHPWVQRLFGVRRA